MKIYSFSRWRKRLNINGPHTVIYLFSLVYFCSQFQLYACCGRSRYFSFSFAPNFDHMITHHTSSLRWRFFKTDLIFALFIRVFVVGTLIRFSLWVFGSLCRRPISNLLIREKLRWLMKNSSKWNGLLWPSPYESPFMKPETFHTSIQNSSTNHTSCVPDDQSLLFSLPLFPTFFIVQKNICLASAKQISYAIVCATIKFTNNWC